MAKWVRRGKILLLLVLTTTAGLMLGAATSPPPRPSHLGRDGPADHDTYVLHSPDGVEFRPAEARLVARQASVADVCVGPAGRTAIYYVDASAPKGRRWRLSVRFQDSSGRWGPSREVRIRGEETFGVDPEAIVLPDGRVRLFYLMRRPRSRGRRTRDPLERDHEVHSALSSDGVNFVREPGVRLAEPGVVDPAVVLLPSGVWRMYFGVHDTNGQPAIRSASSQNGLDFTTDRGYRSFRGGSPGVMVLHDGRVRLYTGSDRGLITEISNDGLHFQFDRIAAPGMEAFDPSLARLPEGGFLVAFKRIRTDARSARGSGPR